MVAPSASPEPAPAVPGSLLPAFQEPAPPAPISPETAPTALPRTDQPAGTAPLVIIDGANVVGSVPDGWWRDRAGAAARLRDRLATVPATGLSDIPPPVEVVLVVEGKARDIPQTAGGVRIERAAAGGSGDDRVIDLVRSRPPARRTVVVTADRGLKARATALGAETRPPSAVPR